MPLSPGTRLGHHDVTALFGEGGMGQVYQARDTKLDRDVALKVLPEAFTAERLPLNLIGGQGDREWYESCSR
jgi:serine/threonine protein kinase